MSTTTIIAVSSAAMVLTAIGYAAYVLYKYEALIRLVGEATEICFLCRKPRLGHDILQDQAVAAGEGLDEYHHYMPALLLYFPDPDLRSPRVS